MTFVRQFGWLAAHATAQCIACLLLSHEQGREGDLKEDLRFLDSLAQMSMEERWKVMESVVSSPCLTTLYMFYLCLQTHGGTTKYGYVAESS